MDIIKNIEKGLKNDISFIKSFTYLDEWKTDPITLQVVFKYGKKRPQKKKREENNIFSSLRFEKFIFKNSFDNLPNLALFDPKQTEILQKGGMYYGNENLIKKIIDKEIDVDYILCQKENFFVLKKFSKQLGPMRLMPSVRNNSLFDSNQDQVVSSFYKSLTSIHVNKSFCVQTKVGLLSMEEDEVKENIIDFLIWLFNYLPVQYHKSYIKDIIMTSTQAPSIKIH